MTPDTLLKSLKALSLEAPLIFTTDEGAIGGGYHVTEFKRSAITSVDCGARLSEWNESSIQLLDGRGGSHMDVGKFSNILKQGLKHINDFGSGELCVEFAPNNIGMRSYSVAAPQSLEGNVYIQLSENSAICKPAQNVAALPRTKSGCGSNRKESQCCS